MKRGQAALEFLTTYGWAVLIILVAIAALAYFGVLNPQDVLPTRCIFSPEVICTETRADSTTDILSIRFSNNVGTSADFSLNATLIGGGNPEVICESNPGGADTIIDLGNGRTAQFDCDFSTLPNGLPQGEKIKFDLTINYQKSSGVFQVPVKGEVYVPVN